MAFEDRVAFFHRDSRARRWRTGLRGRLIFHDVKSGWVGTTASSTAMAIISTDFARARNVVRSIGRKLPSVVLAFRLPRQHSERDRRRPLPDAGAGAARLPNSFRRASK